MSIKSISQDISKNADLRRKNVPKKFRVISGGEPHAKRRKDILSRFRKFLLSTVMTRVKRFSVLSLFFVKFSYLGTLEISLIFG